VKLWRALRGATAKPGTDLERNKLTDPDFFGFGGIRYPIFGFPSGGSRDEIDATFTGYVHGAYKANGPVFAVVLARMALFSEARFLFQRMRNGRGTDLFSNRDLQLLESPWPDGTTGDLLTRAEQDVSMGGNFYVVREVGPLGPRLRRLRPDWTQLILTEDPTMATKADVAGIMYTPGGGRFTGLPGEPTGKAQFFLKEEFAHWAPVPDPDALYLGMSWITPILSEVYADKAATEHKARFFENAATPNFVASFKESVTQDEFNEFVEMYKADQAGVTNAYKTLFLAGGADVRVVGANLEQMSFKETQGAGETRICAAGGVPPIIVGLSEGLQSATYSNYGMARRKFGDHWARPQWRSFCAAMAHLVNTPPDARLWYDDRDIAFLREDEKDLAEIDQIRVSMISALITQGYDPDVAVQAVTSGDLGALIGGHSGLFSVQLQSLEQIQAAADAAAGTVAGTDPAMRALLSQLFTRELEREARRNFYQAQLPRGSGEGRDQDA
jgi:phage portal protein BeeE